MKRWDDMLARAAARLEEHKRAGKHKVVMAAAGGLYGAVVQGGKYLTRAAVPLAEDSEEALTEALGQISSALGASGGLIVVASGGDLRRENRRFPDMDEDELAETMYWEEDRIFRSAEPLVTDWRTLGRDETGWHMAICAIRQDSAERWKHVAEAAGLRVTRIVPATECLAPAPSFTLFGRRRSAILVYKGEATEESRVLPRNDAAGVWLRFAERLAPQHPVREAEIRFVPLAGADVPFWKEICAAAEEEISKISSEDAFAESGYFSDEEVSDAMEEAGPIEGDVSAEEVWPLVLPAMAAAPETSMNLLPAADREAPLLTKNNARLRLAQAAAAVTLLLIPALAMAYFSAANTLGTEEGKLAALLPVKKEMAAFRARRGEEDRLAATLRALEEKDLRWPQKLILLAENVPRGVVITKISGGGEEIRVTGTADSGTAASQLETNLGKAWGGQTRMESRKDDPRTRVTTFTLAWKR